MTAREAIWLYPALRPYRPRQFWLYGSDGEERERVYWLMLEPVVADIADALFGWLP